MNRAALLVALISLPLLAAPAVAEPQWLPVCHDKDVRAGGYAWVHLGIDCDRESFVEVCPPGLACKRVYFSLA